MATRAQQIELLAVGVLYNGAVIANPYAKFLVAGTTTPKTAWDDADKAVAITKKALDAQGRAAVYGDGIYDIRIYSGDPDASGVLLFTVPTYKVTAVTGNTRTVTSATVAGSVDDSLVEADTTSNDITYTLPDAALMAGKIIQIAKSAAANTLTVAAASGQLVNGAASVAYTAQFSTGVFQSNGSNWYVFQTVGDATTLSGYEADTGTTAGTIPVRTAAGFVKNHKGALVFNTVAQSIPNITATLLTFNSESYDDSAIHDLAINTGRLTVPSGVTKVRLCAMVTFDANATGIRSINISKNGGVGGYAGYPRVLLTNAGSTATVLTVSSPVLVVTGGDYFTLHAQQQSGGNLDVLGTSDDTWFSMEIIE